MTRKRPVLNKEIIKLLENSYQKHGEKKWFKKYLFYPQFKEWLPETVGRTLRTLAEDDKIIVGEYNGAYGQKLSMYKLK